MVVTSYNRGNSIKYINEKWVYANDGTPIEEEERPCPKCGRMPTAEGYDACLGRVENCVSACCGHGVESGYIVRENGGIETI